MLRLQSGQGICMHVTYGAKAFASFCSSVTSAKHAQHITHLGIPGTQTSLTLQELVAATANCHLDVSWVTEDYLIVLQTQDLTEVSILQRWVNTHSSNSPLLATCHAIGSLEVLLSCTWTQHMT